MIRPTGEQATDWRSSWWFWGILALAIVLRTIAFDPYTHHHPDETIQYLEQAHRIVFGYGVVPWEFRYFIRSWLIPLLLVPPMQLGEWLNPGGTLYLILPKAMIAAFNLAPVVAAWVIGSRVSRQHAIVAMAVMAIWVECVLFSVQTLADSLSVSCFFAAAALLHPKARMGAIVAAGALMGLAVLMRFPYAPAIAVYALLVAGRDWRMWKGLLIGGGLAIVAGAILDLVMGLYPYQWMITNYKMNIGEQRMLKIGGHSTWHYAQAFLHFWGTALPILLYLAVRGWRQNRVLLVVALVNLLVHQMIGHKEYRYLWLTVEIVLLAAAMGSVNFVRSLLEDRKSINSHGAAATATVIGLWAGGSLALAMQLKFHEGWRTSGGPSRLAAATLAEPGVCGIGVPRMAGTIFGYSLVHVDKPIFLLPSSGKVTPARPGEATPGFNAVLNWAKGAQPQGFPIRGPCAGNKNDRMCLYRRAGGCVLDERTRPHTFQQVLYQIDM